MEQKTGTRRRRMIGTVTSVAGLKSVVVAVTRRVQHPLYRKYLNRTRRYMAHDEAGECGVGDTVQIEESRPLSARKRWRVTRTLHKAVSTEQTSNQEGTP